MKNHTILCIDDDLIVLEFLQLALNRRGYNSVILADSGFNGLFLFKTQHPDVVITDIIMPDLDGISLAKAIRLENASIPIIFISSSNSELEKIEYIENSAVIHKPINYELLCLKILQLLKKGKDT